MLPVQTRLLFVRHVLQRVRDLSLSSHVRIKTYLIIVFPVLLMGVKHGLCHIEAGCRLSVSTPHQKILG